MTWWTRRPPAALAVCAVLLAGSAGCGAGGARGSGEGKSAGPVGRITGHTDEEGRAFREVDRKDAPEIGVEVRPDAAGSWDVRLTVRRFRFSPAGTAARPAAGRGLARLLVDGRPVGRLRTPEYRLSARLVPRGTHHVTARLYADDDTVWAVSGKPVQSTADITASDPHATEGATAGEGAARGNGATAGEDTRARGGATPGRGTVPGVGATPGGEATRAGGVTRAGGTAPAGGGAAAAGGVAPAGGTTYADGGAPAAGGASPAGGGAVADAGVGCAVRAPGAPAVPARASGRASPGCRGQA